MASVHDVAAYILVRLTQMTAMKLEKLVYYCQAWSLVWDEEPLFQEKVEAWANGPVVPELFKAHRGQFLVSAPWPGGDPEHLAPHQKDSIEAVLRFYGDKPSAWLSELTHSEAPWRDARKGLPPGARSSVEITHAAMAEYYGSLI